MNTAWAEIMADEKGRFIISSLRGTRIDAVELRDWLASEGFRELGSLLRRMWVQPWV